MKKTGFFFGLLVIWWATNTLLLSIGQHATLRDVQFALALSLFFGSMTAVPVVGYLVCADFVAKRLPLPFNAVVFLLLVVCGCAIFVAVNLYWLEIPFPKSDEQKFFYFYRFIPNLVVAVFLLVRRIWKSIGPRHAAMG